MKNFITIFLAATLLIMIVLIFIFSVPKTEVEYAKQGVIDLSETSYGEHQLINLDGEWEFYWNQLLEPADFGNSPSIPSYINVPGHWLHDQSGNTYQPEGYATYRLMIVNVPANTSLGLRKQNIRSASKIFINGSLMLQDGQPTSSEETVLLGNSPQVSYFEIEGNTVELIIQVANYHYLVGGIGKSLILGQQQDIQEHSHKKIFFEVVIITIILVVGLIYLILYISIDVYRKREPAIMPFAFC